MKIYKKFFENNPTYSTWAFTIVKSFVLFFITLLILKNFNDEEITLWYLISSIIAFSHLFDLGLSSTIVRFTAYLKKNSTFENNFTNLYNSFSSIYCLISIFLIFLFIVIYYVSIDPLIFKSIDSAKIKITYSIISLITIFTFYLKRNDSFLRGLNKINLYNKWNSIVYLINGTLIIILIFFKVSFYNLVVINQLIILIGSLRNFYLLNSLLKKKISFFSFRWRQVEIKKIWSPTWRTGLVSISSTGTQSLISILVPRFFGISVGGSYLFTMKIIQIINELSYAPFYSHLPKYISDYKEGLNSKNKKNILFGIRNSLIFLMVGVTILSIFIETFLIYIDSNMSFLQKSMIQLILISLIFERTAGMISQIIMISNKINYFLGYIFASISLLVLMTFFSEFGILIIPISISIIYFLLIIYLIRFVKNTINLRFNDIKNILVLVLSILIFSLFIINNE